VIKPKDRPILLATEADAKKVEWMFVVRLEIF
jgi:hypothetical protein